MTPRKLEARYEVTGPGHAPKAVFDLRQGISLAQSWACEHLGEQDNEMDFYVTALGGDRQARIVVNEDGAVTTELL